MAIRDKVLTALRWTVIARFSGQIITWAVTIFVIRILSPADYGMMAMAMVLASLLFLINNIGLETVLVQKQDLDDETRSRIFGIVIVTNLSCFLIMILAAQPLAAFFGEPGLADLIRALSLQFLILIFEALPLSQLDRDLDFKKRSIVEFSTMFVSSLIILALALAGAGVWALVVGHLLSQSFRVIGLNVIAKTICRPVFSIAGTKEILKFGGFVSVDRSLWFIFAESDKFIGGKILGKELLGFYSVANHLASLPINKIAGLISSIAFPAFSKVQMDMGSVRFYLRKSIRVMSIFAFPVFFGISSVAPSAISLLLGEKWLGAVLPLQVLAVVMPVRMISTVMPPVLWGVGKPRISAENFAIAASIMIPAFVIGAQFGPTGLALGWAAAYPIVFLITSFRVGRAVGCGAFDIIGEMAKPIVAAAGMYMAVVTIKPFAIGAPGEAIYLAQLVAIGGLSYACLLILIHRSGVAEVLDLLRGKKDEAPQNPVDKLEPGSGVTVESPESVAEARDKRIE